MKIEIKKEIIGITLNERYWGIVGNSGKLRVISMVLERIDWTDEILEFSTKNFTDVYASLSSCERLVFESEEEAIFEMKKLQKENEQGLLEYGGYDW